MRGGQRSPFPTPAPASPRRTASASSSGSSGSIPRGLPAATISTPRGIERSERMSTEPIRAEAQPADDGATLVARSARGDTRAFETVMRQYNGRLFRVARSILRNDAEAEDALQEAYLDA